MKAPLYDVRPFLLLAAWLLLNLLQAAFSPLDADETYYWMYASQLDWGYFDHPPAVALLIKLGRDWLPGSLGLRLGHVLAGTATVAALYFLLDRPRGKDLTLAAALVFAQPFLHVYGFIATPDGPLLLFTVLYLLAFRAFLGAPTLGRGAIWGLTMAGLMYSKYHGALVILFTVLPLLPRLVRLPGAWLAALGGAALYFPHLYWQYANDYPSFRYHLVGRDDPYRLRFTVQYLTNQLLIFSPLLLYHYGMSLWRDRPRDAFEKSCRWMIYGFFLFFLYSTTKGGTEAQWTAVLSIPLVVITFLAARRYPEWNGRIKILAFATVGLLLLGRIALVVPRQWLPFDKPFDHAPWVERLSDRAGSLPVIFENSYRLASLYEFYSGGKPAYTITNVAYRPNQYDLWRHDTVWRGETVLVAGQNDWTLAGTQPFEWPRGRMLLREIPEFQIARLTELVPITPVPDTITSTGQVPVTLSAVSTVPLRFGAAWPTALFAVLQYPDGNREFWELQPRMEDTLTAGRTVVLFRGELQVPPGLKAGEAVLSFALGYAGMKPFRDQSKPYPVMVTER